MIPLLNIITESVLKEIVYRHGKSAVTPSKMPCKFLETIFKNNEWRCTRHLKHLQKETFEHEKHSDYSQMSSCFRLLTMKVSEMNCDFNYKTPFK